MSASSTNSIVSAEAGRPHRSWPKTAFTSSLAAILGGQLAIGVVALIAEVSYARILGPAARGAISLCLMSIAFGTLFGGLGGEGVIVYWASRFKNKPSSWLSVVLATGAVGSALAGALWIWGYWSLRLPFLRGVSPSSARIILFSIPSAIFFAYVMALASGIEEFRLRSGSALLRQILTLSSFLLFLVFLGRSVDAALWGNLAGLLIGASVALAVMWPHVKCYFQIKDAASHLKPTLAYGVRGQVGNLATFFNYRLDVFIVSYFLDSTQLGFYAVGVAVSEALWQIPNAVGSILFPRTGRSSKEDATPFTCFILRQVLWITSLCAVLVALVAPLAIPLVFGQRFRPSVPVIWWILPGIISLSLAKVGCADLAGRGKNGYSSVSAFICFAATAAADWFLIPRMGINGAALASSLSYSLDAFLILLALRHETGVSWRAFFIPLRSDLQAYRLLWLRVGALAPSLFPGLRDKEIPLLSREGS